MRVLRTAAAAFPVRRHTLRLQLALLYSGAFVVVALALLGISGLLVRSSSQAAPGSSGSTAPGTGASGRHFEVGTAVVFVLAVMLALVLGWLISGRLLRPLRTITAAARDISASDLHQRLSLEGPDDEFKELGRTLDGLFGRLEASFESQRHFVANASHELRTPLTAERTLLQLALTDPGATVETLRATCREVLALGDQQERLIEALLTLASSERGLERWKPFDLADIAGKAIADYSEAAELRDIRIVATLGAASATGDPSLAASMVTNLVDNALRHNGDGGNIDISTAVVSTTTGDRRAVVTVSNSGPQIPPDEVDRLFEPFRRLGAERTSRASGHGLGLAIVRAIAEVHGATIAATAPAEGGLTIVVSFPEVR
jgi:signal transduction histidine kinase